MTSCRRSQVLQFSFRYRIAGGVVDVRDEQPPPAVQTSRAAGQEEVCRPSGRLTRRSRKMTAAASWFLVLRTGGGFNTSKLPAFTNARSAFFLLHSGHKLPPVRCAGGYD